MVSGYQGQVAPIAIGRSGLFTDGAQSEMAPTSLIRAYNCTYYNGILQKDYGSRIWNSSPLPASIIQAREMYTDSQSQNQRIYCLLANGAVYRFPNYYTQQLVAASGGAPSSLILNNYSCMAVGGNEQTNNPKKLFIFTGYNPVQVIAGENLIRTNIASGASDWTGTNQPFGAVIHRNKLFAWGCQNNPHQIYASLATNHEDFTTQPNNFNVYPGEWDGIVCCKVYRGVLWAFKYPLGIYYLIDSDSNSQNWYFTKHSDDFGAVSPQSAEVVKDDLLVMNSYGSISSMKASLVFGNVVNNDAFHQMGNFRFAENEVRPDIVQGRSMVYYPKKRQLLSTFQSNGGNSIDRICTIDFKSDQQAKVTWANKDKPNCLFLVRNSLKVPKPFYGSSDGNIYEMDVPDRWVGSATDTTNQTAYQFEAQTPHMDFSAVSAEMGPMVKLYDYLQFEYEPTGDFSCSCDVYIEGEFSYTVTFNLKGRSNLSEFPLGNSAVDGLAGFHTDQIPLGGQGKTISIRVYNNGLGQDVRLVKAFIYFRLSDHQAQTG